MSFSLCAVFAEAFQKNKKNRSISLCGMDRGMLFLQSTDGLGAQVALLQRPILPAAPKA